MWILTITMSYLLIQNCSGINFIDLPDIEDIAVTTRKAPTSPNLRRYAQHKSTKTPITQKTNHWLFRQSDIGFQSSSHKEDEKDSNIKMKISTLVQQTLHDTERKIKSVDHLKENNRDQPPYRMGFILSMIKKSRDVLNELFNVAVKHRDQWKALEQLKIFELIVHTNVDTTNLVRQLVEIHIQYLNSTNTSGPDAKRRVVLL